MKKRNLNRRTFLKAAGGISVAMPLIPEISAIAQTATYPKRVCFFFYPEGIEPTYWWPTATASTSQYALFGSMAALQNIKGDITPIRGISHASTSDFSGCYHEIALPHCLTAGPNNPSITYNGITTPAGMSIDRFLGRHLKGDSSFQTYEFGVNNNIGNPPEKTFVSYESKNASRKAVDNPFTVFTDLFGGTSQNVDASEAIKKLHDRKKSILDIILTDIRSIRCKLGADGRKKFDTHLESIRSYEAQLESIYQKQLAGTQYTISVDPSYNNSNVYMNYDRTPDVAKLQLDMIAGAFASDLTRVATVQFSCGVSRMLFPWLPLHIRGDYHNQIAHDNDAYSKDNQREDRQLIVTWFTEQYRYLVEKLKSIPEGDGTMLDNTIIVMISDMGIGNQHSRTELPIIIAGKGGGGFKNGQFIKTSKEFATGDLYLTLAKGLGINISRFGETAYTSGQPLGELLA